MKLKSTDLMLIGAVAAGIFLMNKIFTKAAAARTASTTSGAAPYASLITVADGWSYYSDGTSTGPDGKYYKGSDLIYDPAGMYQ